ncbi:MAG: ribonuclease HI [bacterium]|nr:ribonuclease HI [bacterium]
MITIYTDGSSRGNPGPGGWAAIIDDGETLKEIGGREDHTTNNRMELTAAIRSLEFAINNFSSKGGPANPGGGQFSRIQINTDSEYLMKGITLWIKNWQLKGWKTAGRKPVLNQDLWQALLAQTEGKSVEWQYVAGHSGHDANERCDEIATMFADSLKPDLYHGSRNSYSHF